MDKWFYRCNVHCPVCLIFLYIIKLMMQLSIIIPAYNEAENIGKLVNYFHRHANGLITEIIVADGGSIDSTMEIAAQEGAIAVVSPVKGRAAQMHYAASLAKGDILYFVHADTFPPPSFANDIVSAAGDGYGLGRYRTQFISRKWYLKINAWFTRFDWFICLGGDQTLFITRELYEQAGGFKPEMLIMEEYEFVPRARKNGRYKVFNKPALISARKYDTNSWWRVQMANRKIVNMYRKGAGQQEMVQAYKKILDYR
jgi:rSAM/selenodomain-associated transferase 2